jgi:3-demethoxyubiquinol 3-hydroxylase
VTQFTSGSPEFQPSPAGLNHAITPQLWQELRSDHAGELGAVQIYRGILAVTRNEPLQMFARHHMATEAQHLEKIELWVPPARRSRLLVAWSIAGWLTGAVPALFGPKAVYRTIEAVETFVDQHYQAQLNMIDRMPVDAVRLQLRALLAQCQQDEINHRDEANQCAVNSSVSSSSVSSSAGLIMKCWLYCVSQGSAVAVQLAKRL